MDGMAALELVKVFDPELIVLDIMMRRSTASPFCRGCGRSRKPPS